MKNKEMQKLSSSEDTVQAIVHEVWIGAFYVKLTFVKFSMEFLYL